MATGLRKIPIVMLIIGGLEILLVNTWAGTLGFSTGLAMIILNSLMILFLAQWHEAERELSKLPRA